MKKKINTQAIMNELQGQSAFFPARPADPTPQKGIDLPTPIEQSTNAIMTPRYHDTNHDTAIPSNHDTMIPMNEECF